jgi:hypothetical protein
VRLAIWRNTLLVVAVYALAIVAADRLLVTRIAPALALALAFAAVQMAAIVLMLTALFVRKQRGVLRLARSRRMAPEIQEVLALHSIGIDQTPRLEQLCRQSRNDVRETLFEVVSSTRGAARERIVALAAHLGFVERRKSNNVEWIRDLVRLGRIELFDEVLSWAAHQNRLLRAIAAEELAPCAAEISESHIPRALQSGDRQTVITALEMLRAWRRMVHVAGFEALLTHADPRVRIATLLALPYVASEAPNEIAAGVIAALHDENADVRAAGAAAAGKLGVLESAQELGVRLSDSAREVAVAAAFALASMGERGSELLQRAVLSPDRSAASVAFEAMEKAALGRTEMA